MAGPRRRPPGHGRPAVGGATVLVADERVADEFTTDVEFGERFQWGWSALHCLPCAR